MVNCDAVYVIVMKSFMMMIATDYRKRQVIVAHDRDNIESVIMFIFNVKYVNVEDLLASNVHLHNPPVSQTHVILSTIITELKCNIKT